MTLPLMRLRPVESGPGLLLAVALSLSACAEATAAQPGDAAGRLAAPSPTPVTSAKAVFIDDVLVGRDPFFPDSQRRRPQREVRPANIPTRSSGLLEQLVLKGISWNKDRRLVLVNNATLAEGEKAPVRVNGQTVMLQCLEIRERSVLVSIEGAKEVREVHFASEI